MFSFLKYSIINEAVSVKKQNYSWGKMITVHHGSDTSYPLHPEHQAKIKALGDGEKTSFKDETKRTVIARREGDKVHLSGAGSSKKTTVAHSHFAEEVEIDELSQMTLSRYAAKARAQSMDKNNPKRYKRGSGAAQAYDKLNRGDYSEEAQDINYHRAELKKTSDKIDSIVKGGGKVGLNDPLSKKLKLHSAQIKKLKEEINQIDEESLTAGKRLISKHGEGSHTVKVYKDTEYNEYQVHHYKDGKHMGEGPISYHDDKEDAEDTAKMSLRKRIKEEVKITEISKELLSRYKEKAGAQASNLNRAVDAVATSSAAPEHKKAAIDALVKKGNKRFSGIIKATNKQFAKVNETKSAPKGFHFTRDGKLKRGDADVDGDGGKKLRSDPLDKTRNKIPAVSEENNSSLSSVIKNKLSDEGGAAAFKVLKDAARKIDVNLTPEMLKGMSGIKLHRDGDYILEEKDKDDVPFTPDKPKIPSAKAGKYGLGYSTAKHLARMALSQQVKKKQDKTS
jgi:hypothetical protein